jgi:hypothetical protein
MYLGDDTVLHVPFILVMCEFFVTERCKVSKISDCFDWLESSSLYLDVTP